MHATPRSASVALAGLVALLGLSLASLSRSAGGEMKEPSLSPSEITPPGEMEIGVYGGKSHAHIHQYVDKGCCGESDCFVSKIRPLKGSPYQYEAYFQEADGACPRWCPIWLGVTRRQTLPNGFSAVCSSPPPRCGCPRADQFICIYPSSSG